MLLNELIKDAGQTLDTRDPVMQEGERVMSICNACRYCEGYCAVFPAMTRRLSFADADLHYLANLCHNCGECYYACQYAPPHEFAVNVPKAMAQIRAHSYEEFAWPASLARAFKANGLVVSLVLAFCLIAAIAGATVALGGRLLQPVAGGNFYRVIPHSIMAGLFGGVSILVLVALLAGFLRFWRTAGENLAEFAKPFALKSAVKDALSLKYLDNGGSGCTYPGEEESPWRRRFHHFTFYGFMLCFAATTVGTIYHYVFGWEAPYSYTSLPVLLGTLGGIGLLVGPIGLYVLKCRRDAATGDERQYGMDVAFIALLVLASATGLALLVLRQSSAMGLLLAIHLGVIMALFLTLPYGKFVHGLYRSAALVKYALERKRPGLNVGGE
jgi:citrate/tricarballylate utilization protein